MENLLDHVIAAHGEMVLPTFNNEILKLPTSMSVQMASIFAACLAIGRLTAGSLMRCLPWHWVLNACVLGMSATVLLALPMTRDIVADPNVIRSSAPWETFVFP
jgi:fucose permease